MSLYVRLKKGIVESPRYGKTIYPGDNYIAIEDRFKDLIEKDERLEVLTQDEMNEVKDNEKELIETIVNGQWKQSEIRINQIEDIKFLQYKILPELEKANKTKLIQITKDRIEELIPKK